MSPGFLITMAHREELRNICDNYPLSPGDALEHRTADDCVVAGWAERNRYGEYLPTQEGLREYRSCLRAGYWRGNDGEGAE